MSVSGEFKVVSEELCANSEVIGAIKMQRVIIQRLQSLYNDAILQKDVEVAIGIDMCLNRIQVLSADNVIAEQN